MSGGLGGYDFEIPKDLIAQEPLEKRDEARLFVLDRKTGGFAHSVFSELADYFDAGDCLIINTVKVIPARIFGKKETGGKVEVLFLSLSGGGTDFEVLIKPFMPEGARILFEDGFVCTVGAKTASGGRRLLINKEGIADLLNKRGLMPLPPYINRKTADGQKADLDKRYYQTVYAKAAGAIAAPTAGLHFTDDLLLRLENKGVQIARLVLYVGYGTFKPVIAQDIGDHKMMSERFLIDETACGIINRAIKDGKNITAVGTTAVRAIEAAATKTGFIQDGKTFLRAIEDETDIFIRPGYEFQIVNRLITNLHFPKSTPLIMACAFASRGLILKAYEEAVCKRYRFFSYGDGMLIL